MIVADSNLIVSCVLVSEATASALRLRQTDRDWYVPRLWRYEVANILATMIKARRLSATDATSLFSGLSSALAPYERDPDASQVFSLVEADGITGYDAHFVALAKELRCPLYTQDRELLRKYPSLAHPFFAS